jgi:hypothetical protein
MNRTEVERVADAILYEGYLLYPYRPSAAKNRQRWTYGGVFPEAYSLAQGGDACTMQTECLLRPGVGTTVQARVRFLHVLERTAGERSFPGWQEAAEREVALSLDVGDLLSRPVGQAFAFAGCRELGPDAASAGVLVRESRDLAGEVEAEASRVGEGLLRLSVRIHNRTPLANAAGLSRDEAARHALISTHAILHVLGGAFVSLTDPPEDCRAAAAECRNVGVWPVLAGPEGSSDTILASPIILPDYPRVAPESAGDLFDATEIDEILTLRILTLTDDEKRELCAADERARGLLERTAGLSPHQLLGMHGALRRPQQAGEGPR